MSGHLRRNVYEQLALRAILSGRRMVMLAVGAGFGAAKEVTFANDADEISVATDCRDTTYSSLQH